MTPIKGVVLLLGLLAQSLVFASATYPSDNDHISKRAASRMATKTPKYFHEAGGSIELGHYDGRYFKKLMPESQYRPMLGDLIRSYLQLCESRGLETWLAHGTLLGWWWNGQVMPWDTDLDVQVSNDTLYVMGNTLNRTEHVFNRTSSVPAHLGHDNGTSTNASKQATYLLDINPHHVDLTRGDGSNIIDARWIDMENGMFIDITGLRERERKKPGIWSCKNKHRYATQDLWPMRVTEFEGVRAKVPNNFEWILTEEYGWSSIEKESFDQ